MQEETTVSLVHSIQTLLETQGQPATTPLLLPLSWILSWPASILEKWRDCCNVRVEAKRHNFAAVANFQHSRPIVDNNGATALTATHGVTARTW